MKARDRFIALLETKAADREDCWCAMTRKPCSYHEGWDDGWHEAVGEMKRLIAELDGATP